MYCSKCENFLVGNENFCSRCGAKIEEGVTTKYNESEEKAKYGDQTEMEPTKFSEDFNWNIEQFPSNEPKKTDTIDFEWRSDDMFLHHEIRKEEVAFMEEGDVKANQEKKDITIEVPDIFKNTESRNFVTKNTSPVMNLEDERIVEIEQPNKGGVALEVDYSDKEGVKVEKVIVDHPELTSAIMDQHITESKQEEEELKVAQNVVAEEREDQRRLIDEIAPEVVEKLENVELNEEKKQIDKFYTFNRKKEAFQELLDKEYERIERKCDSTGIEDDISSFMDVERGTDVEGTTQLEEMVRARELFFNDQLDTASLIMDLEPPEEEQKENAEEEANVVFEPTRNESLVDVIKENQEKLDAEQDTEPEVEQEVDPATEMELVEEVEPEVTEEEEKTPEVAAVMIDPSSKDEKKDTAQLAKDFFDGSDDEPTKKKRKRKRAVLILSTCIVLITALLLIRIAMPNTVISKYMDGVADKFIQLVTNSEGSSENTDTGNDGALVEDKSGLIQLQLSKNYNNAIGVIKYTPQAKYDSNKTYALPELKDAKDIQTNIWYEDSSGKKYYYNEELVGTVIAFCSERNALITSGDSRVFDMVEKDSDAYNELVDAGKVRTAENFAVLEIGDIKVAGNAYYVWTIETRNGVQIQKVYEIKEKNKKLYVTASASV